MSKTTTWLRLLFTSWVKVAAPATSVVAVDDADGAGVQAAVDEASDSAAVAAITVVSVTGAAIGVAIATVAAIETGGADVRAAVGVNELCNIVNKGCIREIMT